MTTGRGGGGTSAPRDGTEVRARLGGRAYNACRASHVIESE